MTGVSGVFKNTVVPERKFLERWGPHRGWAELVLSAAEGKGKAGPLEAGRGKYSPPASPERVTSERLKRRDKGVHLSEIKYTINSKNIINKTSELQNNERQPLSFSNFTANRWVLKRGCLWTRAIN